MLIRNYCLETVIVLVASVRASNGFLWIREQVAYCGQLLYGSLRILGIDVEVDHSTVVHNLDASILIATDVTEEGVEYFVLEHTFFLPDVFAVTPSHIIG